MKRESGNCFTCIYFQRQQGMLFCLRSESSIEILERADAVQMQDCYYWSEDERWKGESDISDLIAYFEKMCEESDFPQSGWQCCSMADLGKPDQVCEMCGKERVRHVHVMEHAEYSKKLRVGSVCAQKMEKYGIDPKLCEARMKSRIQRLSSFLRLDWDISQNGNWTMSYNGVRITIMQSQFRGDRFGVALNGDFTWKYKSQNICSVAEAKVIAFDLVDGRISDRPESPDKNENIRQHSEPQTGSSST